ncbi:MAG: hypothetical protein JNL08_12205 [Planctomycetes bacterium]|nr:hypothetical protein [Planctomycetota bacterium]
MRSLVVSCALLAGLAAQSPVPGFDAAPLPPALVPIHTAAPDPLGGGGGVFAAGADYKVRFGADGVEFVPYLGAGYPHNQPFAWRTAAITLGGAPLPLGDGHGSAPTTTRFVFARGAAEERWDVRLEGLEQSFWFAARPGDGELRIRGELTTSLQAAHGDHGHADVLFLDAAGTALVRYGRCTAIDADGRAFALHTVVGDGWLELVLPAAAVAAARWPLLVDPLVSPTLLSTSGTLPLGQPRACDVARDDENNQLMVALQRHASATDEDTFLRLFGDDFTPSLGLVFADLDTTWDTTEPEVTFVGGADRWCAVFTREFASGVKGVRWHPHAATDTALDSTVGFVLPPAGSSDLHPDVGGYAGFANGVHAVLCWQRDLNLGAGGTHTFDDTSRIWFARLDLSVAGAGALGAATEVTGTDPAGACDRERPSINRYARAGSAADFLIAFQTYWNTAPGGVDDWDVEGRRIDAAGAFLPGVWVSASNFPNNDHKLGPIVDGLDDEYVIACTLADNTVIPFKTLAIEGSRVSCESYDFGVPAIGLPRVVADTGFVKSLVLTGVSYDSLTRSHALVAHHDTLQDRVYVHKLGYRNEVVEGFTAWSAAGTIGTGGGAVHDDDGDQHLFVFGVEDGVTQPVQGGRVTYAATPAPASYGNPGCPLGATFWSGYHRIGHEYGSLSLFGSSPSTIALALYSLAPANAPIGAFGFGSCTLLIDPLAPAYIGSSAVLTSPSGSANLPIPIPEPLPPFTCYFQWFAFPGPTFANSVATPGLEVTFDR